MAVRELSAFLWEERQLLDLLVFKLEEESLVLASGRHQWLARATSEVEFVLAQIQEMEARREAEAAGVGVELGIGGAATLAEIADAAPEPWAGTFRDHRKALQAVIGRTQELALRNKEVLAKYVVAVSDALSIVGVAGSTPGPAYTADGAVRRSAGNIRLVDAVS